VIYRSGAPMPACLVEFGSPPAYRATTNGEGVFFLSDPRSGRYPVTIRQGQHAQGFTVIVDGAGCHPDVLAANW